MIICGVYKIQSPTGKIYIGSSKNIHKRWIAYKSIHCKKQPKLYKSLLKYGVEAHNFSVVIECEFDELYEYEHLYSLHYNSLSRDGLNSQIPSFNEVKAITSIETKQKISEGNKGKKLSQETKDKISKSKIGMPSWNKGLKCSIETINKIKLAKKNISEETKLKMSISAKNKKLSLEHKQKISDSLKGNKRAIGLVHNDETKKIISEAHKGKKQSIQHILKKAESKRKNFAAKNTQLSVKILN